MFAVNSIERERSLATRYAGVHDSLMAPKNGPEPLYQLPFIEGPLRMALPVLHAVWSSLEQEQFRTYTRLLQPGGILERAGIEFILCALNQQCRWQAG